MKSITISDRKIIPSKIVCVGRNYVEHIMELENEIPDEILIFMKHNSAISNELLSYHQEPLSYEGELCFLYEKNRFSAIGFGLDLTKRQLQTTLKKKACPGNEQNLLMVPPYSATLPKYQITIKTCHFHWILMANGHNTVR